MARGRGLMLVGGMSMGRRSANRQMQQQQQAYQQGQQAQQKTEARQAQATAPQQDTTAELMKLADLHKSGALTDQEFEAAKKKLLS